MPRLPMPYSRESLPGAPGTPRGGLQVPTLQQPTVPDPGASLLERSLQGSAQTLGQLADVGMHMADLEQRRQQAQDVLDKTLAGQLAAQRLDQMFAEQQDTGDYRTLPKTVLDEGNRIVQEVAQERELSPQARALYQAEVQERLTVLQQKALGVRSKRQDEEKTYALSTAVHEAQQRVAQATNSYERDLALGQFDETIQAFVRTGLGDPGALASLRQKTQDAIALQDVQTAIQADPARMYLHLQSQARLAAGMARPGEALAPDLPQAPPEHLAALTQQAFQTQQQRVGQEEHAERLAEWRWAKKQEQTAAGIQARLSTVLPTPDNVGTYDAILADVNRQAQGEHPVLSYQQQNQFVTEIRSLRAAALRPREANDAATERKLITWMDAADNATALEAVRQTVVQNAGLLTPDTYGKFLNHIAERKRSDHWTQQPGVREGFRIILGGDVAESTFMAMLRGQRQEADQVHMRQALDVYRDRIQEIAQASIPQANAEAPEIARQVRDRWIEVPKQEQRVRRLPVPLLEPDGKTPIQDEARVDALLQGDPHLTAAMKYRLKEQWKAVLAGPTIWTPAPATPTQPETTGRGRQKVPQ